MTRPEKLQIVQTAGFFLYFLGSIIRDLTSWTAADYIKKAGVGIIALQIIYMLLHWKEFRDMNIVILVMLGLAAWTTLCILIGQAVQ